MPPAAAWLSFALGVAVEIAAVALPPALLASGALWPGMNLAPVLVTLAAVAALLGGGLALGGVGVLGVGLDWSPRARPAAVANGLLMAGGLGGLAVLAPSTLLLLHG